MRSLLAALSGRTGGEARAGVGRGVLAVEVEGAEGFAATGAGGGVLTG